MRVLLIHPKLENNFYDDVKLPPLGVAYIAGVLREAGHEVSILDANRVKNQMVAVQKAVSHFSPDIVGLSVSTALMGIALKIGTMIKEKNPHIKTIFGGVHTTLFPKDVAKEFAVDYVVYGEGERTIVELVDNIQNSKRLDDVLGIALGEVFPSDDYKKAESLRRAKREGHVEAYYRYRVNEYLTVSPDLQVIWNPYGKDASGGDETVIVGGIRSQVDF